MDISKNETVQYYDMVTDKMVLLTVLNCIITFII